ncbi:hypothetical protein BC831DRAFT_495829 [Entophlyctis helioformis]|nr:hypothetical protein BC831DRAFT_495829 [Entophlyctis helioformis]
MVEESWGNSVQERQIGVNGRSRDPDSILTAPLAETLEWSISRREVRHNRGEKWERVGHQGTQCGRGKRCGRGMGQAVAVEGRSDLAWQRVDSRRLVLVWCWCWFWLGALLVRRALGLVGTGWATVPDGWRTEWLACDGAWCGWQQTDGGQIGDLTRRETRKAILVT